MPQPNEAYLSFLSMKRLGVLLPFHGWQGFPQRFSGAPSTLIHWTKSQTAHLVKIPGVVLAQTFIVVALYAILIAYISAKTVNLSISDRLFSNNSTCIYLNFHLSSL